MPTCRDMSELVTDYLERAVSLRRRLDMWWHLVRCEACRRYYDQMRRTVRLLGSAFAQTARQRHRGEHPGRGTRRAAARSVTIAQAAGRRRHAGWHAAQYSRACCAPRLGRRQGNRFARLGTQRRRAATTPD